GRELHLLEGLPRAWASPGAVTKVTAVPTSFGPVSLTLRVRPDGRSASVHVVPPKRQPPERLVVHLEHLGDRQTVRSVRVNGQGQQEVEIKAETVGPIRIEVDFQ
ncbi:MAG: hypothetical protein GXP27_13725, partial [Planctomycetes bacterium]|nr:hypothetical protein [Planctomycetota bacterium]